MPVRQTKPELQPVEILSMLRDFDEYHGPLVQILTSIPGRIQQYWQLDWAKYHICPDAFKGFKLIFISVEKHPTTEFTLALWDYGLHISLCTW